MKALLTTLMSIMFMVLVGCDLGESVNSPEPGDSSSSVIDQSSSSGDILSSSSDSTSSSSVVYFSSSGNEWEGDTTTNKPTGRGYPMYPTDTVMYGVAWGTPVDSFVGSCARTGYLTPTGFADASDSIKLEVSVGWCYIDSSRTIYFASKKFGTMASLSLYYSDEGVDEQVNGVYSWYNRIGQAAVQKYSTSDTALIMSDTSVMTTVRNFYFDDHRFPNAITVSDPVNTLERSIGSPLEKMGYTPEIVFYRMNLTVTNNIGPTVYSSPRWYMLFFSDTWVEYKTWLNSL